jgi:hypothetical protein
LEIETWSEAKDFLSNKDNWKNFKDEGVPPEIINAKLKSLSLEWQDWVNFKAQQRLEAKKGEGWTMMMLSTTAPVMNILWGTDRSGDKEFKEGWNMYWHPELTQDDKLELVCDLCLEDGIISEEEYRNLNLGQLRGTAWNVYSSGIDVADLLDVIPEAASKPLSCAGFAVGIMLDIIEETEESWKDIKEDATITAHDEWREKPGGGGYMIGQLTTRYEDYCNDTPKAIEANEKKFQWLYPDIQEEEKYIEYTNLRDLHKQLYNLHKGLYGLGAPGLALSASDLPLTQHLPNEKYGWFGLDWDPEWEETWYWEGYDYPATDVNYERYPYTDERGAYDWDYN